MSKLNLLTITVIGLLLLNGAMVVFLVMKKPVHPPEGRPHRAQEGPKRVIIERLNLNAEQVEAYEKRIATHQTTIRTLEDSIQLLKNNLYQTLTNDSFTGKDSLLTHLSNLQKQIEQVHYDHFVELRKLCTPDQLGKFDTLTHELAGFFARRKKNMHPPKD